MADDENAAEELQEGEVSVSELQAENQASVAAVEVQPSQDNAATIDTQPSQDDATVVEVQPGEGNSAVLEIQPSQDVPVGLDIQPSQDGAAVLEVQESQDGLTAEDKGEDAEEAEETAGEAELEEIKGKSGSVKFSEPIKLNESEELERQFDELMEAPDLMSALDMLTDVMVSDGNFDDAFDGEPPLSLGEDMDEDEEECDDEEEEGEMFGPGPKAGRKSNFQRGSFDITPEYIFNELKVADAMKDEEGKNIQSFIISKSFSSENVVVLLNLRRMNDGEWALDKTIAQGLKQETYGGVVSIDQYEFTDAPPPSESEDAEKPRASSKRSSGGSQGEGTGSFLELLKKLEDHVADVSKDISIARKLLKEIPPCVPCSEQNENYSGVNGNENLAFDDLPFFEKLKKIFEKIVSDDDENCDCCEETAEEGISTYTAVSMWLGSIMKDMKEYSPFSYFIPGASGSMEASKAAALISQDAELLEQARESGLLEVLMSNTNPPDEEGNNSTSNVEGQLEGEISTPSGVEGTEEGVAIIDIVDKAKKEISEVGDKIEEIVESVEHLLPPPGTVPGSLQLNVESGADINEFIREHQNVDPEDAKAEPAAESVGQSENPIAAAEEKKSEDTVAAEKEKSENAVDKEASQTENSAPPPEEINDILSSFGMSLDDIQEEDLMSSPNATKGKEKEKEKKKPAPAPQKKKPQPTESDASAASSHLNPDPAHAHPSSKSVASGVSEGGNSGYEADAESSKGGIQKNKKPFAGKNKKSK